MTAVTKLTRHILKDSLRDRERRLAPYTATINVYFLYENVSDNLTMGMARRLTGDFNNDERRALLRSFNQAMIARLRKPTARNSLEATDLSAACRVSLFRQSLAQSELHSLVDAYLQEHPLECRELLECDVVAPLLANIESAVKVVRVLEGTHTGRLVQEGMAARYAAVDYLLQARAPISPSELLRLGTDTVLAAPTLAYYAAVISKIDHCLPGYTQIVADGVLQRALSETALLIRLLNDVGTTLLEQDTDERLAVLNGLRAALLRDLGAPSEFFMREFPRYGALLTRLAKDLTFGESNVCLDGILEENSGRDAVAALEERLAFLTVVYEQTRRSLMDSTGEITRRLGTDDISTWTIRFVEFHRAMYEQSHRTIDGEYAIAASSDHSTPRHCAG